MLEAGSSGHVEDVVDVLQTLSTLWALCSGDWRDLVRSFAIPHRQDSISGTKPSDRPKMRVWGDARLGGPNPNANFVSDSGSVQ